MSQSELISRGKEALIRGNEELAKALFERAQDHSKELKQGNEPHEKSLMEYSTDLDFLE